MQHPAAALWTNRGPRRRCPRLRQGGCLGLGSVRFLLGLALERFADLRQPLATAAVGKKAVVPDAHQALGQHVGQESAQQFGAIKPHRFVLAVSIVVISQTHFVVPNADQSAIAQRGAVAVAGQVGDHRVRPAQTGLGVDHPLRGHQLIQHLVDRSVVQPDQLTIAGAAAKSRNEVAAQVAAERLDREQVLALRRAPMAGFGHTPPGIRPCRWTCWVRV